MKVIIHPLTNVLYSSFYIQGLENLVGKKNVIFSTYPFTGIDSSVIGKNILMITQQDDRITKYYLDLNDSYKISETAYDWCDVYGHVNANFGQSDVSHRDKLVSLCPSFGIRCWNDIECVKHVIINLLKCRPSKVKNFLGKYRRMMQRLLLDDYYSQLDVKEDYVFFCSTLWYSDEWNKNDEKVNLARAHFIRACKSISTVQFEGGLVSQGKDRSSEDKFSDCLAKGVSMNEWIEKTKMSEVVFNTPAFWNCHGWKLGEYLALGKAIISTPLSNDLPKPLEHGKNIHFVDNSETSMNEAVMYILDHPEYRMHLEQGARDYWNQYGTPSAALQILGIRNE